MKILSPRACELVSALERGTSLAEKLLGRAAEDVAILGELAACAEPALVPHLLPFVFGDDRDVARAAASVLDRAISAAILADLAPLEVACRRGWWTYAPSESGWANLRPVEVARFSPFGDVESSVVGVASFHASGYVREAAVTRLDALSGGRELPFLLVRLNDWVTPVAERARLAVERRVVSAYADAFLDSLPILLRLAASKRREHAGLLAQVYQLLRESEPTLRRGLASEDRLVRRISFRLAREAERANATELLHLALCDADTVIRLEAVKDAAARMPTDELAAVLAVIVADPYPPIRREGIGAAADRLGDGANAWLLTAVMDRNQVVREVARFCLRRRGAVTDFAALYRVRLRDGTPTRELATALVGLGETGTTTDTSVVAPFLEHGRPAVRRAAVRALASIDLDTQLPRIAGMLQDVASGVSGTARRILRPRAGAVGLERLRTILRDGPYPHNRFDAASLGSSLSKWESLPILLEAATDGDDRIRTSAQRWLGEWVAGRNRNFTQPTSKQLHEVGAAVEAYHLAIDANITAELRSILRFWAA